MSFAIAKPLPLYERLAREEPRASDVEIIRQICESLLDEADATPPVPVEILASLRGVVRIDEIEQPVAGMLAREGRHFVITVSLNDGYERQRFTICHEIGHTFFAGLADRQWGCSRAQSWLERRCDLAAAELLLPSRFFVNELSVGGLNFDTTEELAHEYEASIEATARRSVDLWPRPALLLMFSERHKPSERGRERLFEPKLRLDYWHSTGAWPYMRRHKSVGLESIFTRAFDGEPVDGIASVGDICSSLGPVHVSARRYGGRVMALIRQPRAARR